MPATYASAGACGSWFAVPPCCGPAFGTQARAVDRERDDETVDDEAGHGERALCYRVHANVIPNSSII